MRIPALAYCYGQKIFRGQIDLDIIEVIPGWYQINSQNIASISSRLRLESKHSLSAANMSLTFPNGNKFDGSGTITAGKKKDLVFDGYIAVNSESIPQSISQNQLQYLLVNLELKGWFVLTPGEKKEFIPDDPKKFTNRPFGFCHIYCALKPEFLPTT